MRPFPTTQALAIAEKEERDRRRLQWAVSVALAAHGLAFLIYLPSAPAALPAPIEERQPFIIRTFLPKPPRVERGLVTSSATPPVVRVVIPAPAEAPSEPVPVVLSQPVEIPLPRDVLLVSAIPEPPPVPADKGPYRVGGEVAAPEKLFAPLPRYTERARRLRVSGFVILEATIDRQGRVVGAELVKGLPLGLSEAALEAVSSWRFRPATLNGRPVDVLYNLTIRFDLQ